MTKEALSLNSLKYTSGYEALEIETRMNTRDVLF